MHYNNIQGSVAIQHLALYLQKKQYLIIFFFLFSFLMCAVILHLNIKKVDMALFSINTFYVKKRQKRKSDLRTVSGKLCGNPF